MPSCINAEKKGILEKKALLGLCGAAVFFNRIKANPINFITTWKGVIEMKKLITVLLLASMVLSLAACGRNKNKDKNSTSSSTSQSTQDTSNSDGGAVEGMGARAFMHSVYGEFLLKMVRVYDASSADEVKGYFAGPETETVTEKDEDTGEDFTYEVPKNEPGAISLDDGETLEIQTLFPAASADKLKSAAVYFNLMNQNNGTFAAFELKDGADMQALADMMKNRIKDNQWICGFPEHYTVMRAGDILVFAYGLESAVGAWKSAVTSVYADAAILYDEKL